MSYDTEEVLECCECGREMDKEECGDESPEERVCDECSGLEEPREYKVTLKQKAVGFLLRHKKKCLVMAGVFDLACLGVVVYLVVKFMF